MLGVNDWVAIIIAFFANLGLMFGFFLKMKVEIAELRQNQIAYEKEAASHKEENEKTFIRIEAMLSENRKDNREDHGRLFEKFDTLSTQLSNATRTMLNNTK